MGGLPYKLAEEDAVPTGWFIADLNEPVAAARWWWPETSDVEVSYGGEWRPAPGYLFAELSEWHEVSEERAGQEVAALAAARVAAVDAATLPPVA